MALLRLCGCAAVVAAAAGVAMASSDISATNAFKVETRIFNDFPGSTLSVTNSFPGPLNFNEQFAVGEIGNFANKHIGWLSNDGGASRLELTPSQSWTMEFDVRIQAPFGQPRKEAGVEVHNPRPNNVPPYTDEGQILIASDGEVAVFGAVMPFTGFGNAYTLGETAHVKWQYFAAGTADPTLAGYRLIFTDPVTGVHDSGLKLWGVETDGTNGFNLGTVMGLKAQNTRNPRIADSSDITYNNFSVVPAPGAIALIGLAGLAAGRRRR